MVLMEKLKSLNLFALVHHHIYVGYFNFVGDCWCDIMQYRISKEIINIKQHYIQLPAFIRQIQLTF